ncbi:MAG: DUF3300 domain-containing protein [Tepidisphaerales bacterium]
MGRLKYPVVVVLAVVFAASGPLLVKPVLAQQVVPPYQVTYLPRTMEQIQQLAAPVALYPDAILAQVLAACTYPDDVIAAAQWLAAGNSPQGIDAQSWDLSVQGVARYPNTLNYLANNVDWMNNLGDAFVHQQADVMSAIQILRAQANAAGNLLTNDRQRIVVEGDIIAIVPANPDLIYIPVYDPRVVYERRFSVGVAFTPLVTFGVGIQVGVWLHHDLDWHDHSIYIGAWGRERPWWHDDGRESHHYLDVRPGVYNSTHVTNIRETTVIRNAQPGRWEHDVRRPVPQPVRPAIDRAPNLRAGTGYMPHPGSDSPRNVVLPTHGGAIVSKESERGRQSLETAGLRPTPRTTIRPEEHPAPHVTPPPATIIHPAPPSPAARPSAPVRGGAVAGYQHAATATQAANRGAASRSSPPATHTPKPPEKH